MTELVVENVDKWLGGQHILKDCSFTARRGSIVALLGASGSGKTTLLRAVAGLGHPERGRITIGERVVLDSERKIVVPPEKRNVGLVFQSYALWPHRTVRENVGYGLKLRGVPSGEIARRVQSILDRLGLGHLAERYPDQLSGGQQQRVAICRALIYEPRVMLLDEPLSNLDAKLREEARYWIRQLILDLELCAVLVTHDQNEALATADQIILLRDGEIVQTGDPLTIYREPRSFFTAEGGLEDGAAVRAVVRVEQISVADAPAEDGIEVDLTDSIYLGDRWEYRLARGGLRAKAHGPRPLPAGKVWARIPPESVWLFEAAA